MKRAHEADDDDDDGYESTYSEDDYVPGRFSAEESDEEEEEEDDPDEESEWQTAWNGIKTVGTQHVLKNDRPVSLPVDAYSAEMSDSPYFRLTERPDQINPYLTLEPSHEYQTLDGSPLEQVIFNLKKAVQMKDTDHAARCLLALFELWVAINQPMRVLVSNKGPRDARLALCPTFGPFQNLNALAMHQTIRDVLSTILFDQVGMGTPTAVLEFHRLWTRYELFLFCDPYMSLASLLGIGQLLCLSQHDGSNAYARLVWGDTAKDRNWRDDALAKPSVLAACMDQVDLERANELLSAPDKYSQSRNRRKYYSINAVTDPHYKYFMQARYLFSKQMDIFTQNVLRVVDDYRERVDDPGAVEAVSLVNLVSLWCSFVSHEVNYLLGHRRAEEEQTRLLIFLLLLKECASDPRLWGLGKDGIFAASAARVASCPINIRPDYARRLHHAKLDRLEPKYGILGEDSVLPKTGAGAGPSSKKKKKQAPEYDAAMQFYARPPVYPRTHMNVHPGFEFKDGIWKMLSVMQIDVNRPVGMTLGHLLQMYLARLNWKRVRVNLHGALPAPRITDTAYFDMTKRPPVVLQTFSTYVMARLQIRHAGDMHPPPADAGSKPHVVMTSIEADLIKDRFQPTGEVRDAIVLGPFPDEQTAAIRARVAKTQRARELLGISSFSTQVVSLVLHSFPIDQIKPHPRVKRDRPATFVVHMPYQHTAESLTSLHDFKQWATESMKPLGCLVITARRLAAILSYVQFFGNTGAVRRMIQQTYVYLRLSTDDVRGGGGERTKVVVDDLRFSVVIDDLETPDRRAQDEEAILKKHRDVLQTMCLRSGESCSIHQIQQEHVMRLRANNLLQAS